MDLTNVAFNTTDAIAIGVLVLIAGAVLWGVRRAIMIAKIDAAFDEAFGEMGFVRRK